MTSSYAFDAPGAHGFGRCHPHGPGAGWREMRRAARAAKMTRHGHGPGHHGPGHHGPGRGDFGFGAAFGPGGPRWGYRRGGPRKRRGDVRMALLLLLAEEPRNGYSLMQEIEQRSDGLWRPSPGSVYPALSQLEDEGLVVGDAAAGGAGRTYSLTDAGRAEVQARDASRPAPWETPGEELGDGIQGLRAVVGQLIAATIQVAQAGSEAQIARAREVLAESRRALYRILAEEDQDAADEGSENAEGGA